MGSPLPGDQEKDDKFLAELFGKDMSKVEEKDRANMFLQLRLRAGVIKPAILPTDEMGFVDLLPAE